MEVESSDSVHAEIARLAGEGLVTDEEIGTTCCFATQDKVWVTGPGGERWEVYTVLADSDTFGTASRFPAADSADRCSCDDRESGSETLADTAVTTTRSCC